MPQLILIGLVLLLWLPATRNPRRRWRVAAILAAIAVAAAVLARLVPIATAEASLGGYALAVLVAGVAWGWEPKSVAGAWGRAPEPGRRRWPMLVGAGLTLVLLCLTAVFLRPEPFTPSAEEILPLPDGLTATVEDGGCGSGACTRYLGVTGRPGQSPADLTAELGRHLKARGWDADCRRAGWILVRGRECAYVVDGGDKVSIELSGTRG